MVIHVKMHEWTMKMFPKLCLSPVREVSVRCGNESVRIIRRISCGEDD
jgi:hypothetical protein